ncbi:MAG: aldehyde dehydrogenase family protein, partial [Candidatus Tectomicrobia bacterium]|nr:aldehyde dehydrogenase family protein [Candidatus Tectomicrobia bacterium]
MGPPPAAWGAEAEGRAMVIEGRNLIGGEWAPAAGGAVFESVNPARTDEVIGRFPRSGAEDAERAVAAAKEAYP